MNSPTAEQLMRANDELFKIKQKGVIANNELKRKLAMIANLWHTQELTTQKLNEILSGAEEDFVWRLNNDAKFRAFVERVCSLKNHGRNLRLIVKPNIDTPL